MTHSDSTRSLKHTNVIVVILLTFVTLGFYVPIWFLRRRKGLNSLDSPRAVGTMGPVILIGLQAIYVFLPQHSSRETVVGWAVLITDLVLAFRVRFILADHLASKLRGSLHASAASISNPSSFLTFFFQIWYLQYKINEVLRRDPLFDSSAIVNSR